MGPNRFGMIGTYLMFQGTCVAIVGGHGLFAAWMAVFIANDLVWWAIDAGRKGTT